MLRKRDADPFTPSLIHSSPEFFRAAKIKPTRFTPFPRRPPPGEHDLLDCGGQAGLPHGPQGSMLTSANLDLVERRYPESWEGAFPAGGRIALELAQFGQVVVGLKVALPPNAQPGQRICLHFVQRALAVRRIVGGIALHITVAR